MKGHNLKSENEVLLRTILLNDSVIILSKSKCQRMSSNYGLCLGRKVSLSCKNWQNGLLSRDPLQKMSSRVKRLSYTELNSIQSKVWHHRWKHCSKPFCVIWLLEWVSSWKTGSLTVFLLRLFYISESLTPISLFSLFAVILFLMTLSDVARFHRRMKRKGYHVCIERITGKKPNDRVHDSKYPVI
jgi:hypothetical protein